MPRYDGAVEIDLNDIDLNGDVGESYGRWHSGDDAALLNVLTSANIACGFHAGDPTVMRQTVRLAVAHSVAVGAHPGYADLRGFGRFEMELPLEQLQNDVLYQLGALHAMCKAEGAQLSHVKAHGALYNRMAREPGAALAVARAVADFNPDLPLLVLANSPAEQAVRKLGLKLKREAFVDRAYLPDGRLQPRGEAGSVLTDPEVVAARALQLATSGTVTAIDGSELNLTPDSLCIHGDTPDAAELAHRVRAGLEAQGVTVRAFS